jgi:hypothetical protein
LFCFKLQKPFKMWPVAVSFISIWINFLLNWKNGSICPVCLKAICCLGLVGHSKSFEYLN